MNRGRDRFNKFKPIINLVVLIVKILPFRIRLMLFEFLRMVKGYKGIFLRYILIKTLAIQCGDNVLIHSGVYLFSPQNLSLGDNVSVHPMCYIDATGGIEIGNDVSIAHGVTIMSTGHNFEDINIPIKDQGCYYKKVVIHNNVWVGAKATILAGIKVSSGSIIGAGAVVTKDVSENNIVIGVPARVRKVRGNENVIYS